MNDWTYDLIWCVMWDVFFVLFMYVDVIDFLDKHFYGAY